MQQRALQKKRLWTGIALTVLSASVFGGTYLWINSRTFVALNKPISLARGSIKSEPFKINLKNYYNIEIDTGWKSYFDPNCLPYNSLRDRWTLYRNGSFIAKSEDSAYFQADEGWYQLQLDILSNTACLNPGHPRLLVYTDRGEYADRTSAILLPSGVGIVLGISLAVLAFIPVESNNHITDLQNIETYFQYAQKLSLGRQFKSPPAFALIAAPLLILLIFILMTLLAPSPEWGIYVHLLKPAHSDGGADPFTAPVITCIADAYPGTVPEIYVNSTATSWDKLEISLKNQLKLRPPKWTVYIEAEPNVPWADAAAVVDTAKGLHASVILKDLESPRCEASRPGSLPSLGR